MTDVSSYLLCSAVLYVLGLYCLATSRNMIRLIIGIEILTTAANLNFIAFSSYVRPGYVDALAHSIVIMSIVIGACVIAVGLTIAVYAYRHYGTLDVRELRRLRW